MKDICKKCSYWTKEGSNYYKCYTKNCPANKRDSGKSPGFKSEDKGIPFPKYAKIIKGSWKRDDGYGDTWCKIIEMNNCGSLSLKHPKYGEFAWVYKSDCIFK